MLTDIIAYLCLAIDFALVIGAYAIYRDQQLQFRVATYLYAYLNNILKRRPTLTSDMSSSSLVGQKITIQFVHEDEVCTLILPYNRRKTNNGGDIVLHHKDGSQQQIKFPPGCPFPYTPSQLGVDKITRFHLTSAEDLEYTDDQIVQ